MLSSGDTKATGIPTDNFHGSGAEKGEESGAQDYVRNPAEERRIGWNQA
jgi:hypothetical protein